MAQATREPSLPYSVKPSDKLIVMSRQLLSSPTDWKEVARFNGMKDPNAIRAGQAINIPLRLMKSQTIAGKIISTYGDVQLAGNQAAVGHAVAEGGKLQTGPNSSAVLELGDGSRVTLLPNTLAELVTSRHYANATHDAASSGSTTWFSGLLRLAQGGLETLAAKSARRAMPLQIETPTSLVGVRGTQFRVAYDDPASRNARTEVLEGAVKADNTAQHSSAALAQGQGAILNPAVKDIKVLALPKAPDLSALPSEILKPQALWPMPAGDAAKSYRVQVASDEGFNKIVRDMLVTSGSADFSSLANGAWFARVRSIDPSGIEGFDSVKAVQVVLPPPPVPIPQPPRQWNLSQDRLDVVSGRHILQFSQLGLDRSHAITATITTDKPPYTRIAEASAKGDTQRISMDLGNLDAGALFRLHLTVTQEDGAKVIPLDYRFAGLSGFGWAEGMLRPVAADKR